ncbi:MAG: class I SAM-dependent DNA methyltransferase [Candidatus Dormibacteria bacterium]
MPLAPAIYRLFRRTGPASYFDRLYGMSEDPFSLETSRYDARKRRVVLDMVGRKSHHAALDAGCGTGMIANALVPHCRSVVAVDFSAVAVARARKRNQHPEIVEFSQADLVHFRTAHPVDLVVCSEVLYYLEGGALDAAVSNLHASCAPDAWLIVVLPASKDERVLSRIRARFHQLEYQRHKDWRRSYSVTLFTPR